MTLLNDEMVMKEFGEFIRAERERVGRLQSEVAQRVDITQTYYSLIERGKRNISLSLAINICESLNLDFNHFIKTLLSKEKNSTPT